MNRLGGFFPGFNFPFFLLRLCDGIVRLRHAADRVRLDYDGDRFLLRGHPYLEAPGKHPAPAERDGKKDHREAWNRKITGGFFHKIERCGSDGGAGGGRGRAQKSSDVFLRFF